MSQTPGLYEKVLQALGDQTVPPPKPPRPSASVVPWRHGANGIEVFWIQRAESLSFMGGWHAFPGGGLNREDAALPIRGTPQGGEGQPSAAAMPETLSESLDEIPPNLIPGLAACALRELLEETGILPLGSLFSGTTATVETLATARYRAVDENHSFAALVEELGLELEASHLQFAGRWLTPPMGPIRFDNRFFLLEWPAHLAAQPSVVPGEAAAGEWVLAAEGFRRWQAGEVIAAPPIVHLLRVLAEDGPEAGLGRLLEPAEMNLGPYRRIEFRPGVILLPLLTATLPPANRTNCFLLGRRERVLIDPGSCDPAELDRLAAAVAALRERGEPVTAIWLTHHHPDHIAGVNGLRQRLGVPVLAHIETARRLAGRIAVDRELLDGQRIVLDGDPPFPVRVVHTPGHARGHLCFLDEDGSSLVCGDMLSAVSTIVIDPPEGDMDDYLASLTKLAELAPRTLFPAHGPPIKNAVPKIAELIAHRLQREERILAAWRDGVHDVAGLRERVYDDVPPMVFPLAERQIEAHLIRLRRDGRIEGSSP